MIFPGPGIGGYCLPKDGGLGYWAYKHILGFEDGDQVFKMSTTAIDVNDTRGLHVATLTRDALRNMGRYIAGADVLICGASYRQDVGDTRYSGSEIVVRKLTEMGAEMRAHDPYVDHWYEFEKQDSYPAPGHSWSRFFRNQEHLTSLRVEKDLATAARGIEAVILAVPHAPYLRLAPATHPTTTAHTLPSVRTTPNVGKLDVRKFAPGIGSWMSVTAPTVVGRVHFVPPSRDTLTTCEKPCSKITYTVPSGPVAMFEPCRPLPVPLLPAGDSCFGAPNDAAPLVDTDTIIGSLP
jgi:hypothetical protein